MFSHLPQPLLIIQKSGHHFHPKQQRKRIGCALAVAKKHVLRFLRFIMLKLRPSRMGPGLKLVPGLGSSKNHGPVGPVDTPIINSPNRKRCTFWRISNIKIPTCSHVPLLFLETVKYISGKKRHGNVMKCVHNYTEVVQGTIQQHRGCNYWHIFARANGLARLSNCPLTSHVQTCISSKEKPVKRKTQQT